MTTAPGRETLPTVPLTHFIAEARISSGTANISGIGCWVRVETLADPLIQQICRLDKLVDERANWRPL